jgi:hypothetical protein
MESLGDGLEAGKPTGRSGMSLSIIGAPRRSNSRQGFQYVRFMREKTLE